MTPPFKQHRVTNELEPRGEFQVRSCKQLFQFIGTDILRIPDFIRVDMQLNICLDEEDVIDYINSLDI